MGRKTKLTPEVQQVIVDAIRDGAYDWVAAQAAGISDRTFYNWMERGQKYKRQPYFHFFQEVCRARAEARRDAETRVFKDDPKFWLRCGPGKEKAGQPGWTELTKHEHSGLGGGDLIIRIVADEK